MMNIKEAIQLTTRAYSYIVAKEGWVLIMVRAVIPAVNAVNPIMNSNAAKPDIAFFLRAEEIVKETKDPR